MVSHADAEIIIKALLDFDCLSENKSWNDIFKIIERLLKEVRG